MSGDRSLIPDEPRLVVAPEGVEAEVLGDRVGVQLREQVLKHGADSAADSPTAETADLEQLTVPPGRAALMLG